MTSGTLLQTGLVLLLLGAGVVSDLRERKVRNQLVVAGFALGLAFIIFMQGPTGLLVSGLSFVTAIVAVLPLYLLRVLGGGDVKLLLAASVLMNWQEVLITIFGSMIWGSLLGVLQVILKGQGKAFAHNILALAQRVKPSETAVHKIPYTVALLFGYLSSLVWSGVL